MALKKRKTMPNSSKTTLPKSVIGARSRRRGHSYECKIVKELKEITKDEDLCTSRSESKKLDDMKIDIADPNNTLPFYCQIKSTQQTPQIQKLNTEVGKKDKPLVIFWANQESRDTRQFTIGEYCIMPKTFFYDLLKIYETSKN